MNDRPTSVELLRAVRRFLEREVVPSLDGPRRYHARIAANVCGIVAREIETEEDHLTGEWQRLGEILEEGGPRPTAREELRTSVSARNRDLIERIRSGDADAGPLREAVLRHLRRTVADKLDVARPPRED
jgi:hypothetical protein